MFLLICLVGAALLLVALVLLANRRRRRPHGHQPPSAGVPASGSPTTNAWTFGSGQP